MKKRKKVFLTCILSLITLSWLGIIFLNSNLEGASSQALSKGIVQKIVGEDIYNNPNHMIEVFNGKHIESSKLVKNLNYIVRKAAHMLQFGVLTIAILLCLKYFGVSGNKAFIIALTLVFIVASLDELNQLFIDNRTGSIKDVGFDFLGALIGATFYRITLYKMDFFNRKINQV